MLRLLRFIVILGVYAVLFGLLSFLLFNSIGMYLVLSLLLLTLAFYFYFAHNLITGFFQGIKLSEVFFGEVYSDCRNEFFRLAVKVPQIYKYESNEVNSILLSSAFGSSHILLSSELLKSSRENIKAHFLYAVVKQRYFPSSRIESLVGSFGLFNVHLINVLAYPFDLIGKTFDFKLLLNIKKILLFLFVPLFGMTKRFVLGVNRNNKVYEKMNELGISKPEIIDAIIKANDSFNSNLFELDLIEYNKFLSNSFSLEKSEIAF